MLIAYVILSPTQYLEQYPAVLGHPTRWNEIMTAISQIHNVILRMPNPILHPLSIHNLLQIQYSLPTLKILHLGTQVRF